mmetsp:Transcript_16772/g.27843  ORF Transcript_16772/g.27843 Transcript_16772/m.27843 type:complete len:217 (-) Transcript_16772:773-1423(-)
MTVLRFPNRQGTEDRKGFGHGQMRIHQILHGVTPREPLLMKVRPARQLTSGVRTANKGNDEYDSFLCRVVNVFATTVPHLLIQKSAMPSLPDFVGTRIGQMKSILIAHIVQFIRTIVRPRTHGRGAHAFRHVLEGNKEGIRMRVSPRKLNGVAIGFDIGVPILIFRASRSGNGGNFRHGRILVSDEAFNETIKEGVGSNLFQSDWNDRIFCSINTK